MLSRHLPTLLCSGASTMVVGSAAASTITVDLAGAGDHLTIAAAISAAVDGDVVLVQPGTYTEDIDFAGRSVTVEAAAGPGTVELVGTGLGPVVRFDSGEGPGAAIIGLVIRGGDGVEAETGGCVHIVSASPTLQDVRLTECVAVRGGGVFIDGGSPSLADVEIDGCRAVTDDLGDRGYGGGLYATGASLQVVGLHLHNNLAVRGGGGMFASGTTTLSAATIDDNDAERGGGLVFSDGLAAVDASTFGGNDAAHSGGAISVQAATDLTIANSVFDQNIAPDGGALRVLSATLAMSEVTLSRNVATGSGGALRVDDGTTLSIAACDFDGNEADYGGAALLDAEVLSIRAVRVRDNLAYNSGGGLYVHEGVLTLSHAVFVGNTAGSDGGALRFEGGSGHLVENALFSDNASTNGAAIHLFGGAGAAFRQITAVENSASSGGSFRATADTTIDLRNSIVAYPFSGTAVSVADGATWAIGWTDAYHPDGDSWAGDLPELAGLSGNLEEDPRFVSLLDDGVWNDDVRLGPGSPCIDAGDPSLPMEPDGTVADLGAYGGAEGGGFPAWDDDGDGFLWLEGDCNDARSDVHPGHDELCDGLDRDCDGAAWENCGDDDDDTIGDDDTPADDDSAASGDDDDSAMVGDDDSADLITPDTQGCACNTDSIRTHPPALALAFGALLTLRRPRSRSHRP